METIAQYGPALVFWGFAVTAVVGALMVVVPRNPVVSAMALVASLVAMAVLFLLLSAEFLAIIQILVYTGGIVVLFLFVIFLVNVEEETHHLFHRQRGPAILLVLALGGLLSWIALRGAPDAFPATPAAVDAPAGTNMDQVGLDLFQGFLLPFEIISVLLLVALVGAIYLAKKDA